MTRSGAVKQGMRRRTADGVEYRAVADLFSRAICCVVMCRRPRLERVLVVAGDLAPVGCYEGVHIREVAKPAQRRLCRGPAPRRCPTVDRAGRYSQRNWNVTKKIVQRRFGVTFVEVDEGSASCKKERSVSVTVGQPDGQRRKLCS